jgi:hypothetical protein
VEVDSVYIHPQEDGLRPVEIHNVGPTAVREVDVIVVKVVSDTLTNSINNSSSIDSTILE